jgi:hypothetical protein
MQDLILEHEFYSKKFYFSYSGLNKLLFSPVIFYRHYVLNQQEDRTDAHLIEGSLLHNILLEPDSFNDKYIVVPGTIPAENSKKVIDKVFAIAKEQNRLDIELNKFEPEILQILVDINLHQTLKTDVQRIDKIVTDQTEEYYEFLRSKGTKTVIDNEMLDRVKVAAEQISSSRECSWLLGLDNPETKNEVPIMIELSEYPFGLKGFVDNIRIDHTTKTIYVNDLKTTGKYIQDFPETVEYYNYWLQAAIYMHLVKTTLDESLKDYEMVFHFIVIDKLNQVYAYPVSKDSQEKWQHKLQECLEAANFHYTQRVYNLPYKFLLTDKIML